MCKERSISNIAFIVFIILQNYIMFNYYFLSESIKTNGQIGYFVFISMLLLSGLLILILPKKIGSIKYFHILKKSFVLRNILLLAKIFILFMTLSIGVRTLSVALFPNVNFVFFLISLIIVSIIISNFNPENIINTACILFLVGMMLLAIPLFLNNSIKDYTLLFPLKTINNITIFSCIYLFLDSITLVFFNDGCNISKKDILIGVVVLYLICIIETINVIALCGTNYLHNNEFLGFFSLYIQDTLIYIGNFSFIYIYLIPCVCVFKSGLSIVFIKNILNVKKNILFDIVLFCLLFISIYLTLDLGRTLISFLIYFVIVLLFIIYLFFISNRDDNIEVTI